MKYALAIQIDFSAATAWIWSDRETRSLQGSPSMMPTRLPGWSRALRNEDRGARINRERGPRLPSARAHMRSKACWRSFAASPSMRTAVSRQGERRRRIMPCFHSSPMPMPPVMPLLPSTTSTLRWSRGRKPSHARNPGGLKGRTSSPSRLSRLKYDHGVGHRPSQSISTRTLTPRSAASMKAFTKRSPTSSLRKM